MSAPARCAKAGVPARCARCERATGCSCAFASAAAVLASIAPKPIADCAARFGNGVIEISSRANLQLRGVGEADLPALQDRLDELGLLDADAAAESVRNIVASPLSDIDPTCGARRRADRGRARGAARR